MSKLQDVLQQIDSLSKELESLPAIAEKDEVRLWEKFRLEWNYNSNHIEGNTLTYGETMLLLIKGKTTGDHDIREYDEMKAHDVAVDVVKNWAVNEVRPLTSGDICDLNKTLLVRPFWKAAITQTGEPTQKQIIPGQYKTTPNHVKLPNGETFRYAEPEDVQREMQELIDWYRDETADLHPLITAAMLHYRFVCIHPFDDGNGRVSRLLMNYHLLKNEMPPIIIKSDDKKNYLTALSKADARDEESFIVYVGKQLLWSLELAVNARKGESIEEDKDWKKEIELLKRNLETKVKQEKREKGTAHKNIEDAIKKFLPTILNEVDTWFAPFASIFKEIGLFVGTDNEKQVGIFYSSSNLLNSEGNNVNKVVNNLVELFSPLKEIVQLDLSINLGFTGFKFSPTFIPQTSCRFKIEFSSKKMILFTENGEQIFFKRYVQKLEKSDLSIFKQKAIELKTEIDAL